MMKKWLCALCALVLLMGTAVAAPASRVEITLSVGESYRIPEARRGEAAAEDPLVVRAAEDEIIGLAPGRTVVHVRGAHDTDFIVLVLFGTASADLPAAQAPVQESAPAPAVSGEEEETGNEETEIILQLPGEPAAEADEPIQAPEQTEESGDSFAEEQEEIPAGASQEDQSAPIYQHYDREEVPDLINGAIDLAFTQWTEDAKEGTKKFSRLGKYNKYSYWQCGSGAGCDIGWCGAFLGYVFDNAGVPMDPPTESVPHEEGVPYSVRAAGVGKINTGFSKMDRLSMTPRPGYFVIYGQQKGYGYKHIGLVTDVDDLGDGRYLLKTVEGNMSSTIRRYCYLFDSNETVKNMKPCPDEYVRDDLGINAYEHVRNWNITTFCQTWQ